jgi:class 3 adenylate cyclase
MDQGLLLLIVTAALVVVCVAWATRELLARRRARATSDEQLLKRAAGEVLVPLLVQSAAALVRYIGRDRSSIESLVGPDGTVSLLFCDIEASTQLNRRLGDDEWVRVLRAHDEVVDRIVRRNGGMVVKTQGDGFMAAFRAPVGAVSAAMAFGPELREDERLDVPFAVRVGVHTGTVVAEKGDLFGTNVTIAARIAAAASGDEVLVSEAVREHLTEATGLVFRRRRALRLKGLPGRHRVYAVAPV